MKINCKRTSLNRLCRWLEIHVRLHGHSLSVETNIEIFHFGIVRQVRLMRISFSRGQSLIWVSFTHSVILLSFISLLVVHDDKRSVKRTFAAGGSPIYRMRVIVLRKLSTIYWWQIMVVSTQPWIVRDSSIIIMCYHQNWSKSNHVAQWSIGHTHTHTHTHSFDEFNQISWSLGLDEMISHDNKE